MSATCLRAGRRPLDVEKCCCIVPRFLTQRRAQEPTRNRARVEAAQSRRPKTTQKGSALPPTPRLLLPSTRARAARRAQPRTTAAPRCLQWPLRVRDCVFDTALQRGGARRAKGHPHSDTCLSSVVRRLHQPLLLRVRRAVCSGLCHSLRALCPLRRARSGCSGRALPASQWCCHIPSMSPDRRLSSLILSMRILGCTVVNCPCGEQVGGALSLRVQQLNVQCETKVQRRRRATGHPSKEPTAPYFCRNFHRE